MSNAEGTPSGPSSLLATQLSEDGARVSLSKPKLDEKKSAPPTLTTTTTAKPTTRTDDRNFRNHYYEKVGFRGMDERKTLELILKDDPINREKCVNFALRCTVPSVDRLFVWKLLLGEEAAYPSNKKDFDYWKERTYNDCKRLLTTAGRIDPDWPTPKKLTVLWLLFDSILSLDFQSQLVEFECQNFMSIAESMLLITGGKEVEAFWLARGLAGVINKHSSDVIGELVETFHRVLSKGPSTNKLYNYMEKIGLNEEIPLRSWICRGFAGVLKIPALERLWDKLCCGALKLMPFVAMAMVDLKKNQLFGCQTAKEAIRCLLAADDETNEKIIQKGLEMWFTDGTHLLPPVDNSSVGKHMNFDASPLKVCFIDSPKFQLISMIDVNANDNATIQEEDDIDIT